MKWEIETCPFCSVLKSAVEQSEMEVVLRCENNVHVNALTIDFTMLYSYVGCLTFHCWHHVVVIIVSPCHKIKIFVCFKTLSF